MFFDKCVLASGNQLIHPWSQSVGQQFGDYFGEVVDEANRSEV